MTVKLEVVGGSAGAAWQKAKPGDAFVDRDGDVWLRTHNAWICFCDGEVDVIGDGFADPDQVGPLLPCDVTIKAVVR